MIDERNYPRLAASAMIALRRYTVADVCAATGISEQVLWCFIRGSSVALSDASFHDLFRFLGVVATEQGARLDPERVHFFHLEATPLRKRRYIRMFKILLPLMDVVAAMTLPRHRGVTPILVRGSQTRIALLTRGWSLGGISLADLGLANGPFCGSGTVGQVPLACRDLLVDQQIKANYFDLIMSGDFKNESIDLVRLVALDRDVTLSDVVAGIASGKISPSGARRAGPDEAASGEKVIRLFPDHFRARTA